MREALDSIVKSIRKGQDKSQYLVLGIDLLDVLSGITCSPFGAAEKGSLPLSEDARMIYDLSYPMGASVNKNTCDSELIQI